MLAKLLQIGWINNLDVFNPPALITLVDFGQFLNRAYDFRIGGVTNGVNSGLKAVHGCADHEVSDFRARQKLETRLPSGISIRPFQPRPPAAQGTIKI
jgi:hypothetical protein